MQFDLYAHPHHEGLFVTRDGRVFQELKVSPASSGYHTVKLGSGKRTIRRHTLMCETFHGPRPPGMQVLHGPNGAGDDSPDNLSWGTQSQNMDDRIRDGTSSRGEQNWNAQLTIAAAQEIFDRRKAGERGRDLAEEFGVNASTVCDLYRGRTWPEINREG